MPAAPQAEWMYQIKDTWTRRLPPSACTLLCLSCMTCVEFEVPGETVSVTTCRVHEVPRRHEVSTLLVIGGTQCPVVVQYIYTSFYYKYKQARSYVREIPRNYFAHVFAQGLLGNAGCPRKTGDADGSSENVLPYSYCCMIDSLLFMIDCAVERLATSDEQPSAGTEQAGTIAKRKVLVSRISEGNTSISRELEAIFRTFGDVTSIKKLPQARVLPPGQRKLWAAIVEFKSEAGAQRALHLDGVKITGHSTPLSVRLVGRKTQPTPFPVQPVGRKKRPAANSLSSPFKRFKEHPSRPSDIRLGQPQRKSNATPGRIELWLYLGRFEQLRLQWQVTCFAAPTRQQLNAQQRMCLEPQEISLRRCRPSARTHQFSSSMWIALQLQAFSLL